MLCICTVNLLREAEIQICNIYFSKIMAPLAKTVGNKSYLIVADEQAESSDKTNFSEYPLPVRRHFQGLSDQFSRDEFISFQQTFPTTSAFHNGGILNDNVQNAVHQTLLAG